MGTPNAHTAGIAKAETKFMLIAESGFANGSNPQQKPNRCKTWLACILFQSKIENIGKPKNCNKFQYMFSLHSL